ncbi:uncharacterized protein DUF2809 [Dokdonia sp. Hel_I_63]|uniref:ribosomal maturation YjgA family protein n=1 Tax=Dokdonia sp. Hel_I_63 TaxID=1249996 RepID=UPI00119982AD|nr:DUF2809 domain-containing protein [Dokdonia sp. Hel_I_63]TVZ22070.1 uncharacterized protein DUF2809 [Dokdonia sp. Hel_I_63]
MRLSLKYIIAFLVLLAMEIFIAIYVHDDFIRPYLGDSIVVVLIYVLIMGLFNIPRSFKSKNITALAVLLFAFIVEGLQAISFINYTGLADNKLARIILGTSFSWWNMLAYVGGYLFIIIVEKLRDQA